MRLFSRFLNRGAARVANKTSEAVDIAKYKISQMGSLDDFADVVRANAPKRAAETKDLISKMEDSFKTYDELDRAIRNPNSSYNRLLEYASDMEKIAAGGSDDIVNRYAKQMYRTKKEQILDQMAGTPYAGTPYKGNGFNLSFKNPVVKWSAIIGGGAIVLNSFDKRHGTDNRDRFKY